VISSLGMKCAVGLCKVSCHLQTPHLLDTLVSAFFKTRDCILITMFGQQAVCML
jgi:hypothetical protein